MLEAALGRSFWESNITQNSLQRVRSRAPRRLLQRLLTQRDQQQLQREPPQVEKELAIAAEPLRSSVQKSATASGAAKWLAARALLRRPPQVCLGGAMSCERPQRGQAAAHCLRLPAHPLIVSRCMARVQQRWL